MEKFNQYDQLNNEYETKLQQFKNERAEIYIKLEQAQQAYRQVRIDGLESSTKTAKDTVVKARNVLEGLRVELVELDEQIALLEEVRADRLRQLYPELEGEFEQIHQKVVADIQAKMVELKKIRCEYVLKCVELHQMGLEASEAFTRLHYTGNKLGVDFKHRLTMPSINLTSTYFGNDAPLAPLPDEVMIAYNTGKVQPFIKYYGLTGELVDNKTASERLAKGGTGNE